jgi:hypothetical protein
MTATTYIVKGQVWLHPGTAGWHFVTLPAETADEIRARFAGVHRPFQHIEAGDAVTLTIEIKA